MAVKPTKTGKAFFGAYRKGRAAFELGNPKRAPYEDLRGGKYGQVTTYSRSFIKFWNDGWEDAKKELPERYFTKEPEKKAETML